MKGFVVILSLVVANSLAQSTDVYQCVKTPDQLPVSTYIDDCETPPCIPYQQEYNKININFTAPSNNSSMTTSVTAYLPIGKPNIRLAYNIQGQNNPCWFEIGAHDTVSQNKPVDNKPYVNMIPVLPQSQTCADIGYRVTKEEKLYCFSKPFGNEDLPKIKEF